MSKITEITVHAGRVIPHPFTSYSNLKPGISYKAVLEDGEDAVEATKRLQAQAEGLLEDHCRHMITSLEELEDLKRDQARVASLKSSIENAQRELDRLREKMPAIEMNGASKPVVKIDTWEPRPDGPNEEYEYDPEDKA